MSFLFVDKISKVGDGEITGERYFSVTEPFQYKTPDGERFITSGALSEAVGQLASWYCLANNEFRFKPIFMFSDVTEVSASVHVDSLVNLSAKIHYIEHDVFRYSGEASVGGRTVLKVRNCFGYFIPIEQFEDPVATRLAFQKLLDASKRPPLHDDKGPDVTKLIDDVLDVTAAREIVAIKTLSPNEPFYPDHFPRCPITPIVVLCEMVCTASELLFAKDYAEGLRPRLRVIRDVKIRQTVKPGDQCITKVTVDQKSIADGRLCTTAEVQTRGRWVMRCKHEYHVH